MRRNPIERMHVGTLRWVVSLVLVLQGFSALAQTSSLRAFYDRCNTIFFQGTAKEQRALVDSLKAHLSNDPVQRALGQVVIARGYRSTGQARLALEMLDSITIDLDKAHHLVRYSMSNERARGLKMLKMFPEAMLEAQRSRTLAVAFSLREEEVNALVLIAELHRAQSEYEPALAKLIEAEKLATVFGYTMGLCNVAINRGNILNRQERYAEARAAYRSARDCAENNGFPEIAGNALFNEAGVLSIIYPDSLEAGLAILRQGLTGAKAEEDLEFIADLHTELGRMLNDGSRFRDAVGELRSALRLREQLGDTLGRAEDLLFLSTSYLGEGLLDSALSSAREAADLSGASSDLDRQAEAIQRTAELLAIMGQHEKANTYFKDYINRQKALAIARNGEAIKVMEYRFETEKKENTILLQGEQIASDRVKKRGMLLIAVLLLLVTALAIRNNQHMRRMSAQQQQLHEREVNDLLKHQEIRALDAMMEGQEAERTRIAKDLHDRLGSMLSAIKLQFSALESRVDTMGKDQVKQYKHVFGMLDDAVTEVRRISHDLLKASLSRFGLKGALEDLRTTLQAPGKLEVEMNLFGLEERLEQRIEVAAYRIVQECISNALKHAQASTLAIQLTRSPASINIIVEDNGKGFDPAQVKEGMGMGNLRQRAAEFGGVVRIDARLGRGTTVNIDIPLAKQGA